MKILLAGQKRFGRDVAELILSRPGWQIVAISCPVNRDKLDKLHILALNHNIPVIPSGTLCADRVDTVCGTDLDLIVSAHCHDFIGRKTRQRAQIGALGYHPSLLPLHRGRSAIEWAIRFKEPFTGGTAYWLNDTVDGGPIAAQAHVPIRPKDTALDLWTRDLAPLGLKLFSQVFAALDRGEKPATPQDHALATWEPALDGVPSLHRPDLELLPAPSEINKTSAVPAILGTDPHKTFPDPLQPSNHR